MGGRGLSRIGQNERGRAVKAPPVPGVTHERPMTYRMRIRQRVVTTVEEPGRRAQYFWNLLYGGIHIYSDKEKDNANRSRKTGWGAAAGPPAANGSAGPSLASSACSPEPAAGGRRSWPSPPSADGPSTCLRRCRIRSSSSWRTWQNADESSPHRGGNPAGSGSVAVGSRSSTPFKRWRRAESLE